MARKPYLQLRRYISAMERDAEREPYPADAKSKGGFVSYEVEINDEHHSDLSREQLDILAHALLGAVQSISTMGKQTEEIVRNDNMRRVPALNLLMSFFEIDAETYALLQREM